MMRAKPKLKLNVKKNYDDIVDNTPEKTAEDEVFQIEPRLYLTSYAGAKSHDRVKNRNIDLIFNISISHCQSPFNDSIEYKEYDLRDLPGSDIKQDIKDISKLIEEALDTGRSVLVHCYKVCF